MQFNEVKNSILFVCIWWLTVYVHHIYKCVRHTCTWTFNLCSLHSLTTGPLRGWMWPLGSPVEKSCLTVRMLYVQLFPMRRHVWSTLRRPFGFVTSWTASWNIVGPSCWSGTPGRGSLSWLGTNWDRWTQRNTWLKTSHLTITPHLLCSKVGTIHL